MVSEKKVATGVRMLPSLKQAVKIKAAERNLKFEQIVEDAIRDYLAKMEGKPAAPAIAPPQADILRGLTPEDRHIVAGVIEALRANWKYAKIIRDLASDYITHEMGKHRSASTK